jgi:hypothetical protein
MYLLNLLIFKLQLIKMKFYTKKQIFIFNIYFVILILKYFENPEKLSEKLKVSLFQCFRKTKVILRMIQCLRKSISKLINRNLKINDKTESLLIGIHVQFSKEVKLRYFPKSFSFSIIDRVKIFFKRTD